VLLVWTAYSCACIFPIVVWSTLWYFRDSINIFFNFFLPDFYWADKGSMGYGIAGYSGD
jgi:hypothetical protein